MSTRQLSDTTLSWEIAKVNQDLAPLIQTRINQKTKPIGALGQLEAIAHQMALVQKNPENILLKRPVMLVFAADHGISAEGISIADSKVTTLMVLNFLADGAAINCFCQSNHILLKIIDAGIAEEINPKPAALINRRIASGTANFAHQAAMSKTQAWQALAAGHALALAEIEAGSTLLSFGEMGIGNSSAAAAILAAISGRPVKQCVGYGTGITADQFSKKITLIEQAVKRIEQNDPLTVLCEVGGFEIAQICGAMLATASAGQLILVDGFIVSAAALLAYHINPNVRDYMIFAHCSEEPGHRIILALLNAKPLLDLDLRLGEGTGAALAWPLLLSAAHFYNHMATFESTGIEVQS